MKIILAAFEPELSPLRLPHDQNVMLGLTGVGAIEAAVRTSFLLKDLGAVQRCSEHDDPTEVLFIGSCGAVDQTVPLLSTAIFSSVTLASVGATDDRAFFPSPMQRRLEASGRLHDAAVAKHPTLAVHAYSTVAITRERMLGDALAQQTGARFENLELFGVALACAQLGVPWCAISTVTNHIYEGGHDEWLANHKEAAARTAILVEALVKSPHLK